MVAFKNINRLTVLVFICMRMLLMNIILLIILQQNKKRASTFIERANVALAIRESEEWLENISLSYILTMPSIYGTLKILQSESTAVFYFIILATPKDCNSCLTSAISMAEELINSSTQKDNYQIIAVFISNNPFDIMRSIKQFNITFPVVQDTTDILVKGSTCQKLITPAILLCNSNFKVLSALCLHYYYPERIDIFYQKLKKLIF